MAKRIFKEKIYTNYKWSKKKGSFIPEKKSETLTELACRVCDSCGAESGKGALGFLEFIPGGWSVVTVTTGNDDPLGDNVAYDFCGKCTREKIVVWIHREIG